MPSLGNDGFPRELNKSGSVGWYWQSYKIVWSHLSSKIVFFLFVNNSRARDMGNMVSLCLPRHDASTDTQHGILWAMRVLDLR